MFILSINNLNSQLMKQIYHILIFSFLSSTLYLKANNQEIDLSPNKFGVSMQLESTYNLFGFNLDYLVASRLMLEAGVYVGEGTSYSFGTRYYLTKPKDKLMNWNFGLKHKRTNDSYTYNDGSNYNYDYKDTYTTLFFGFSYFALSNLQVGIDLGPVYHTYEYNGSDTYTDKTSNTTLYAGLKLGYRFGSKQITKRRQSYSTSHTKPLATASMLDASKESPEKKDSLDLTHADGMPADTLVAARRQFGVVNITGNDGYDPKKLQKVSVLFTDGTVLENAVILSLNNETILLAMNPTKESLRKPAYMSVIYPVTDIQTISARNARKGAIIGGIAGGVTLGLLVAFFGGLDGGEGLILTATALGGLGGMGLGALFGQAVKTHIIINGNIIHYQNNLHLLEKYSIEKYKTSDHN